MSNTWFTADTHFNHANIIRYCNRPFSSVEEHNEVILDNLNTLVKPEDTLFHLGDFSFGDHEIFRKRIRCRNIIMIIGNHDPKFSNGEPKGFFKSLFPECHRILDVNIYFGNTYHMVLCHYAMRVWNRSHHGAFHLYGHSHGTLPDDPNSLSFDVGVDCHEYKPISMSTVVEVMSRKSWKPIDHHDQTKTSA